MSFKKVSVIGLGYIGLPTAAMFASKQLDVIGIDVNIDIVNKINAGEIHIVEPKLDEMIKGAVENGFLKANTSPKPADAFVIAVPTPFLQDNSDDEIPRPDLNYIHSAAKSIANVLKKGDLVILESTSPVGTTEKMASWMEEVRPDLSFPQTHGDDSDIRIAYCPERFNPGDPAHGVRQVARVIGCSNPNVGEGLVGLYSRLTSEDVRYVGKLEVAEAAKVIENVQRDINIALVNELARIFPELDVDVEDVLSAAATKWNFHRYTPGVGVGGHCIPVDPYYMMQRAADVGVPAELITAARAVNRTMPIHVAGVLNELLYKAGVPSGEGKVLLLGWSYKAEVGDPRETPAEPLTEALQSKDISVAAYDPHLNAEDFPDSVEVISDIDSAEGYDLAVLVTAHKACQEIDWAALASRMRNPILYDGRRVLDLNSLQDAGWQVHAVGRPM